MCKRFLVTGIEGNVLFDVDLKTRCTLFYGLDIVADLAFEANVGYKSMSGLCIDARQVACIRVAVGIAVFYIEQDDKFVSIFNGFTHSCCSSSFFSALA